MFCAGFNFGAPGSDNAITVAFLKKKFIVGNPAYSIRTYHLQNSNIRTYITSDVLDKPIFLYVGPNGFQDYQVIKGLTKFRAPTRPKSTPRSFNRPIKYVDKTTAETSCNMMPRNNDNPKKN